MPGSISACLAACLPSKCCYSNQSDVESCFDGSDERSIDACRRYKPYCDVVYDAWEGATEGVLKIPNVQIVQLCMAENGLANNNKEEEAAENGTEYAVENATSANITESMPSTESFERKRLRGHRDTRRRKLRIIDTPNQICQQHCKSARCCHAPAYAEGLVLSASGVYTDSVRGDHVVTDCQEDFGKNRERCSEYDKFCDFSLSGNDWSGNGLWTSRPTPSPSARPTMRPSGTPTDNAIRWTSRPTPSPTVTSLPTLTPRPTDDSLEELPSPLEVQLDPDRPSSTPTATLHPTISSPPTNVPSPYPTILPAQSLEISASCSGTENIEMIAAGLSPARIDCLAACSNGL